MISHVSKLSSCYRLGHLDAYSTYHSTSQLKDWNNEQIWFYQRNLKEINKRKCLLLNNNFIMLNFCLILEISEWKVHPLRIMCSCNQFVGKTLDRISLFIHPVSVDWTSCVNFCLVITRPSQFGKGYKEHKWQSPIRLHDCKTLKTLEELRYLVSDISYQVSRTKYIM
jgi:hypothetical protein